MNQHLSEVINLLEPESTSLLGASREEAEALLWSDDAEALGKLHGSFCLLAQHGKTVRMARSLDRPMRYFLAKKAAGPALIVANRIDVIRDFLRAYGMDGQFHPTYTRMVPAHYRVEIQLVGCPDPDPVYTRFFTPELGTLTPDLDLIGKKYIGAVAEEIERWLLPLRDKADPIGVSFSGGVDSGAIFVLTYWTMQRLGMNLGRLKAFTLQLGNGPDLQQARAFLDAMGLGLFLEPITSPHVRFDLAQVLKTVEDYKPLDIQSAAMAMHLLNGIRERYPDWKLLLDGEGGDENLKDYPIEENPELTIRSVVHNRMLYQEGWGVGKIKHSLTYSGGLSRSYARSYGPARRFGFETFSPFTRPSVIRVAEAIPFIELTKYDVPRLYSLKGEVTGRGVKALTGLEMPVFEKRRFQHGAMSRDALLGQFPDAENQYRRTYHSFYA
ncbi:MAG TPA: asparagine synthase-related protein [Methylomirabilota bacterium]|nr:asparagine synthase-related protein [Methylomirabilota bacterium]